jgi:transposase
MELLNLLNFQFLAPYSPKMNPIEEYFGSFKNKFKCKIFSSRISLVNEIKKQVNFEPKNLFKKIYIHSLKNYIKDLNLEDIL